MQGIASDVLDKEDSWALCQEEIRNSLSWVEYGLYKIWTYGNEAQNVWQFICEMQSIYKDVGNAELSQFYYEHCNDFIVKEEECDG